MSSHCALCFSASLCTASNRTTFTAECRAEKGSACLCHREAENCLREKGTALHGGAARLKNSVQEMCFFFQQTREKYGTGIRPGPALPWLRQSTGSSHEKAMQIFCCSCSETSTVPAVKLVRVRRRADRDQRATYLTSALSPKTFQTVVKTLSHFPAVYRNILSHHTNCAFPVCSALRFSRPDGPDVNWETASRNATYLCDVTQAQLCSDSP